jgi:Ca2+-binding RTX toxin-like protein
MVLATIQVPISGGGSPTVIWTAPYTVAAGGVLPVPAGVYPAGPYVGQYVDDATLGLMRYNGTAWLTTRPRIGASVNLSDSWATQATRTHAGTWSLGEDSGGFVGALTADTTPITIPAGKGGLYSVSLGFSNSVVMTAAGFVQISIGGTLLTGSQSAYRVAMQTSNSQGGIGIVLPLAAGCTLQVISGLTASAYAVTATLSCYRIGD